jgi:uncharacterized membrane protein YebE (DUF533 family)
VSAEMVANAARAAAAQLTTELGLPTLEVDVEEALYADGQGNPDRYFDPVAIASLIVAAAQFAYQVYTDQKKKHGTKPSHEVVARQTRIHLQESGEAAPQRVLDAVVTEVLIRAAEADDE